MELEATALLVREECLDVGPRAIQCERGIEIVKGSDQMERMRTASLPDSDQANGAEAGQPDLGGEAGRLPIYTPRSRVNLIIRMIFWGDGPRDRPAVAGMASRGVGE